MFPPSFSREAPQQDANAPIRQTDSDAALARLSAVQKQYLQDAFIKSLVPKAHLQSSRPPLINIGTYVRSEAIDQLVNQWLALAETEGTQCQIVSLGAGSDTRFWRIATSSRNNHLATYVELDFVENTTKKAMAIRKSKELGAHLHDVKPVAGGTGLHSRNYHLIPVDLRVPPSESFEQVLTTPSPSSSSPVALLSPNLPTLLLFECVLVYMTPTASSSLIQWFTNYFATTGVLGGIVYEMFGLGDSFGKVMLNNLKSRNVSLPGVDAYPTFGSLTNRFTQHDFTASGALTLRDIRRSCVSKQELDRISSLEMLDEIEELELVLQHYAVTWGVKLPHDGVKANWKDWGLKTRIEPNSHDEDD